MSPTIAHILPFPHVGGTELGTLRIAEAVSDDGFEHVAFHTTEAHAVRGLFESHGFRTCAWDPVQPSYRHPTAFVRNSRKLARALRSVDADLIHCADYDAAHFAAVGGLFAGIPVLCHVRNRKADVSLRDRTFVVPVSRYVFVSEQTRRDFPVRAGRDHGAVVYDGIDVPPAMPAEERRRLSAEVRSELGLPVSARVAGMVARIAPQKDYETLIRAAALVRRDLPDLYFVVVGDHEHNDVNRTHYAQVQEWLKTYGDADRFLFTGYRTDVDRLVGALDVFVLSTHQEGLPLVLLEAMVQAKPVLATAVDGIPEAVEDGKTGCLHPHGDSAALARDLREVFQTPDRATALGRAGRERVERKFSREMFRSAMVRVYRSVMGAKNGR